MTAREALAELFAAREEHGANLEETKTTKEAFTKSRDRMLAAWESARAILATPEPSPPREATPEMETAGREALAKLAIYSTSYAGVVWRAMYDAAHAAVAPEHHLSTSNAITQHAHGESQKAIQIADDVHSAAPAEAPQAEPDEFAHRLRQFAEAYPESIFRPVSKDDEEFVAANRPGLIDRCSAAMGRHLAKFFVEAAARIESLQVDEERARVGWDFECDDLDRVLARLGFDPQAYRTDGGRLNRPKLESALAERDAQIGELRRALREAYERAAKVADQYMLDQRRARKGDEWAAAIGIAKAIRALDSPDSAPQQEPQK